MRIIIVGDGKVGSALAEQLSQEDHEIVVIDSSKSVLQETLQALDVRVVHGNGAVLHVQKEADVETSDLLIAATSADEINLLCCILARKLGCPHTIARVRNMDYYGQLFLLQEDLGLSMAINPERGAANEIFRMLQFPSFMRRDSFAKGRVEIVEILLQEDNPMVGKSLQEMTRIAGVKVLVCAVERGAEAYIPDGAFHLEAGDKIYVTASRGDLARLIRNLELVTRRTRSVIVVGGSRIAVYLARDLLAVGVDVKIMEIDEERCNLLADLLPKATILLADGSNRNILDSEGIEETDAVVTLTGIDEENLIISMYADFKGVPKVITKINHTEFNEALRDKGIDCVVSPKELCATDVVRYVRAMQNSQEGEILTLHRIVDNHVEALEFLAAASLPHLNETLADVVLKPHLLIACINRKGKILIPQGSDVIAEGDTVVVVTRADRKIRQLRDIFEE